MLSGIIIFLYVTVLFLSVSKSYSLAKKSLKNYSHLSPASDKPLTTESRDI